MHKLDMRDTRLNRLYKKGGINQMGKTSVQPVFVFEDPNSTQAWRWVLEQILTEELSSLASDERGGEE